MLPFAPAACPAVQQFVDKQDNKKDNKPKKKKPYKPSNQTSSGPQTNKLEQQFKYENLQTVSSCSCGCGNSYDTCVLMADLQQKVCRRAYNNLMRSLKLG